MQQINATETRSRALEHLILLLLGAHDQRISILHLEKEAFFLWNFHPDIKKFMKFISHYRGPYSEEIEQIIRNPFNLINCWTYIPPARSDTLTGGYVELTSHGRSEYRRLHSAFTNPQDRTLPHTPGIRGSSLSCRSQTFSMYVIVNNISAMSRFLGHELCRRFSASMVSVDGKNPNSEKSR